MLQSNYEMNSSNDIPTISTQRKFSFPATFYSTSLLDVPPPISARRRLSNVSDAVSRKLSYTIGWKSAQIPAQDIISQGKCICGQYIKRRLRRSDLFNKKLGLQKVRSIIGTTTVDVVRDVFPVVIVLGEELEKLHPRVYTGIYRQISHTEMKSPETAPILISSIARDLFRVDITWGKIISLFAVAGGLAVDCVRFGHTDYLPKLIEGVTDVIEDELVPWINDKGGWIGLNSHVHLVNNDFTAIEWATLVIGGLSTFLIVIFLLRFIGIYLFPIIFNKTV